MDAKASAEHTANPDVCGLEVSGYVSVITNKIDEVYVPPIVVALTATASELAEAVGTLRSRSRTRSRSRGRGAIS